MLALAQVFTDIIAPPVCVLCHGDGQQLDELWGMDLCEWCEAACVPLHACCPRCGVPVAPSPSNELSGSDAHSGECANCRSNPPPFDAAFCPFRYEDPLDLLITGLKFRHDLACARVLGMLLARRYSESGRALPDCVVPIPLHSSRLRERGFNQCAEIARHLAPRLQTAQGQQVAVRNNLLQRHRATRAQSELSASERAANLSGAFRAKPGATLPRHIALLDDVLTTGNTAAAAAGALKEAGCERVEIWACARALRDGPGASARFP